MGINKKILCLFTGLSLSISASSTTLYGVTSVLVTDIHSDTFEGDITLDNSAYNNSQFIPAVNPDRDVVNFVAAGSDNGGTIDDNGEGYIIFDGNELIAANLQFPDYNVTIDSGGLTSVETSGAGIILSPHVDNTVNQFQYDGGSNVIADFSTFTDVTVNCTGPACGAIPFLNLDGLKYEIIGNISAEGGDTLTLRLQTDNDSVLEVEIITGSQSPETDVPFPSHGIALLAILLVVSGYRKRYSKCN